MIKEGAMAAVRRLVAPAVPITAAVVVAMACVVAPKPVLAVQLTVPQHHKPEVLALVQLIVVV